MRRIVVEDVHKVYKGHGQVQVAALAGVTFSIEPGEFVSLMGPSGCGKSTLLHVIGGMDKPSRGAVRCGELEVHRLCEDELVHYRRRRVGFIFQFFNLLPTLTVVENVGLPLLLDGASEREIKPRVEEAIAAVGLTHRLASYPGVLSGGELQRAAAARAIVGRPDVILADEPTGSLDSHNGEQLLALLQQLNRDYGVTILMATHSAEAAHTASRTIRLKDGVVENALAS